MKNREIDIIYKYNHFGNSNKSELLRFSFKYDNETKILDIKNYLAEKNIIIKGSNKTIGLIHYYNTFDYIIGENEILWNQKIEDVKIVDYIRTFDSNKISIENVSGGVGDVSFLYQLNMVFEIIEDILKFLWDNREVISCSFTFYQIFDEIKKYIRKTKKKTGYQIEAHNYFFSILIKNDWDLKDFMEKYNFKEEQAIDILKLLGYKYIKIKNIYHITNAKRNKVVNIINEIDQLKSNEFANKYINHQ